MLVSCYFMVQSKVLKGVGYYLYLEVFVKMVFMI